ncbi:hypothetical protein [Pontibacter chitinilyticus]|uniref:hypothetical protein n=1 Tax=Pontibacter chitinilyticus TaxID=2674989 RepID=UPI00321C2393
MLIPFIKEFKAGVIVLLLSILGYTRAHAAGETGNGFTYTQNYTKSLYQAGNQNWSVARDGQGILYFGNSNGLLTYDGSSWQLYRMPHHIIVRAVAAGNHGRIYVGGFGELGYWDYLDHGKFTYHSLTKLIPRQYALKDEVWKIYVAGDKVIFQSFASIFIYEHGKISVVKAPEPYLFLFQAGGRFFAEVISKGLYELKGDQLVFLEHSGKIGTSGVLSILPFGPGEFLIGTAKNGLYKYNGSNFIPWQNEANDFLKANQLNNGAVLAGGRFAFGTILNGIVILDKDGHVLHTLNKTTGLQNNTVLSLYADGNHNLWAGLDNGIDRVEVNSPLYFFFDKAGRFGTVYASIIYQNKIYLGTNQGLFYSDWNPTAAPLFQSLNFRMIPDSQGQVWDLSVLDGELLCGHNEGTFRVKADKLERISEVKGGWDIKKLNSNPAYLVQGTYTGLVLYTKDKQGKWAFDHKLEGFREPVNHVEQDNTGHLWATHPYKGLYRLTLSDDLRRVKKVRTYGQTEGLPSNFNVMISKLYDQLVFSSAKGFYTYDAVSDTFTPYTQLNKKLGTFASSGRIIPATDSSYWFIDNGHVALAKLNGPGGKAEINANQFSILDGRMVQQYENISKISDGNFLISIDDGFVIYNMHMGRYPVQVPPVLIRRVENTTGRQKNISDNALYMQGLELPYNENNIRFTVALPYYQQASTAFQYFLEGYAATWSAWGSSNQKEYTNLGFGDYRLHVRARVNGSLVTQDTVFHFRVLPPWYASGWAWVGYGVLALLLAYAFKRLYALKLQRDKARIQQVLEQEKQEHLRQEALLNEQKIVKLKNEQLQSELAGKSRELASTALNIVYKNELLQNIRQEVDQLQDEKGLRLPEKKLRKIQKIIDEGMSDERDWLIFENSFNEANENYFKKLREEYPELTPNDLKLCALLRMNMSSKEMASLLNITVRSVELRRYRLRKKLNMEHDQNLVGFIMEF